MAGSILVRDTFDGMTSGASIVGRVPNTTESGYAWKVETSNGTATSDGAGNVRFSAVGASCQQRTLAESQLAVRVKWNDGGSANGITLYIGDRISTTIHPRSAYGAIFIPRGGEVRLIRFDDFGMYLIGSAILGLTFNLTADVLAFERNGNVFRAIVNGIEVGSFTDASKPPDGTRRHHGMLPFPFVNNSGKCVEFEIFDSIETAPSPLESYTIVDVF